MDPDEFLDLVAHELKTPLTPLKAAAQLMRMRLRRTLQGGRELDLEGLDKSAAMVERQVDRMDRLVTAVLEVTRMGRGRFQLARDRFDVAESVREAAGDVAEMLEDGEVRHRIDVDADGPIWVVGDRARLTHALTGVVENAVKFSPSGGAVRVSAHGGDGGATIEVSDEGIGIESADLAGIGREPFERPARTETYAGLGVGLYLARMVAEGHGGRLDVASEGPEEGTTVTITVREVEAPAES